MAFAKIAERQEALRRNNFIADITSILAGMDGGKDDKTLTDHMASLFKTHTEEK